MQLTLVAQIKVVMIEILSNVLQIIPSTEIKLNCFSVISVNNNITVFSFVVCNSTHSDTFSDNRICTFSHFPISD